MNEEDLLQFSRYYIMHINENYPTEHFGVADKFLIRMCAREVLEDFSIRDPRRRAGYCPVTFLAVSDSLERFGFKTSEFAKSIKSRLDRIANS